VHLEITATHVGPTLFTLRGLAPTPTLMLCVPTVAISGVAGGSPCLHFVEAESAHDAPLRALIPTVTLQLEQRKSRATTAALNVRVEKFGVLGARSGGGGEKGMLCVTLSTVPVRIAVNTADRSVAHVALDVVPAAVRFVKHSTGSWHLVTAVATRHHPVHLHACSRALCRRHRRCRPRVSNTATASSSSSSGTTTSSGCCVGSDDHSGCQSES
jgi:hypothetical protein